MKAPRKHGGSGQCRAGLLGSHNVAPTPPTRPDQCRAPGHSPHPIQSGLVSPHPGAWLSACLAPYTSPFLGSEPGQGWEGCELRDWGGWGASTGAACSAGSAPARPSWRVPASFPPSLHQQPQAWHLLFCMLALAVGLGVPWGWSAGLCQQENRS